jgi:hypothetical protein
VRHFDHVLPERRERVTAGHRIFDQLKERLGEIGDRGGPFLQDVLVLLRPLRREQRGVEGHRVIRHGKERHHLPPPPLQVLDADRGSADRIVLEVEEACDGVRDLLDHFRGDRRDLVHRLPARGVPQFPGSRRALPGDWEVRLSLVAFSVAWTTVCTTAWNTFVTAWKALLNPDTTTWHLQQAAGSRAKLAASEVVCIRSPGGCTSGIREGDRPHALQARAARRARGEAKYLGRTMCMSLVASLSPSRNECI